MILWTDVESTGFDERKGHLLEVALVLTDDDLNEVAYTSEVIRPVGKSIDEVMMDDVVRKMHTANGLIAEIKALEMLSEAEEFRLYKTTARLINFLQAAFIGVPDVATGKCVTCGKKEADHFDEELRCPLKMIKTLPGHGAESLGYSSRFSPKTVPAMSVTPFAGSTIAFDRRWLREHMQPLEAMLGYRSIDVSSVTELAQRWALQVYKDRPKSDEKHRALSDVRGSIALLKFYRKRGFIGGGTIDYDEARRNFL